MELGLHIAYLTWNGGPAALAPTLARVAKEAEDAGVSRITMMDHVWQISAMGPVEDPMLEAYTALGFLAAHTQRALLHVLVTGAVYRAPGLLAKQVTTLDVLSGGRAGLGIGAAWNEEESRGLGLLFPPTAERFERLEEAIQICLQMWSGSDEPYTGAHYQLERTLNSPPNLSQPQPYLMIGGSGEQKTLRLVAKYADACNIFFGPEAGRKLEVLRAHCEREGRDYAAIDKTTMTWVTPETTRDELLRQLETVRQAGFTVAYAVCFGPEPLAGVELLGSVYEEIAAW
jgi:F420-dependent oxidoreductase-like protein